MRINFTKMQGLGNDFAVIDATRQPFPADAGLLARLGDRHFGVGCDQILVVEPPPGNDSDFGYRIYNSDGSESGQCLNGARCIARFIKDRGLASKPRLRVRTPTRMLELEILRDDRVRVDAGAPDFEPRAIPLLAAARAREYLLELADDTRLACGAVGMGNPHAVIAVADVDSAAVETLGAALQNHPAFPERVNVGFLQVIDTSHARLRVYERGAGETLACGSGACAAMAVARLWERLGPRAEIVLRGGTLELEWAGEGQSIWMTGPAETVYEGSLEWPI